MSDLQLAFGLTVLLAFGAAACLAWGIIGAIRGSSSVIRARLNSRVDQRYVPLAGTSALQVLRDRRMSRIQALNLILNTSPLAQAIALDLARARIPLRVGEYLLLRLVAAAGAGLLLSMLGGSALAIVPGAILGYFAPKVYVGHKNRSRIATLDAQLVEALSLSANSLRAGWGFMQAMAQVANDMPPPISEEFTQVLQEVSIGTTNEAAIQSLIGRVPSYDMELVMTAVLIQRQIGGNLAEMMDNIAFTIRERTRLIADIASITSESTMSMWVLSLLPVALLVFMAVTQPQYMGPFMTDPRGRMMLIGAACMEIAGVLVMRRMANVKV